MSYADEIPARAVTLAEEVAAAIREQRPLERIEAMLLSALWQTAARERERCAELAEERAQVWQRTRLNDPSWPASGRAEAQARYKEAVAIADAIRAGTPLPPPI